MYHKRREYRRYMRNKKINKRLDILKTTGPNGGSLYEPHLEKIENNGGGYMSKHGTLTHYARGSKSGRKTNNKGYGPDKRYSKHDKISLEKMSYEEKLLETENKNDTVANCEGCFYREFNFDKTPICVHKASMEGIEAEKCFYKCSEVETCIYFEEKEE